MSRNLIYNYREMGYNDRKFTLKCEGRGRMKREKTPENFLESDGVVLHGEFEKIIVPMENVLSFTMDGEDFRLFLCRGRDRFDRYELVLRTYAQAEEGEADPYHETYPHIFAGRWLDKMEIFLQGKRYVFTELLENGAYWTLAQRVTRRGDTYIYSFDRTRRPVYFSTPEFELDVSAMLNLPHDISPTEADAAKIEEIELDDDLFGSFREEYLHDLAKLPNLKSLSFWGLTQTEVPFDEAGMRRLGEACPCVEMLEIGDYIEIDPHGLAYFPALRTVRTGMLSDRAKAIAAQLRRFGSSLLAERIEREDYGECVVEEHEAACERRFRDAALTEAQSLFEEGLLTAVEYARSMENIERRYAELRRCMPGTSGEQKR